MNHNLKKAMGAALVGLPLFMVGCGGGGGGGLNPSPTPGVTPGATTPGPTTPSPTTPSPTTPGPTTPAPTSTERINIQYSQPVGGAVVPTTTTFATEPIGYLLGSSNDGYALSLRFTPLSIQIEVTKETPIVVGDKFTLRDEHQEANAQQGEQFMYMDGYWAVSGTVEVLGLTYLPSADPNKRKAIVKFKVSNAVLRYKDPATGTYTRGYTVNATGETTVINGSDSNGT